MKLLQTTFIAVFGLFAGAVYSDQVWRGNFQAQLIIWSCCFCCAFEPVKGDLTLTIMDNAPREAKLSLTYLGDYECGATRETTIIISEINQNTKAEGLNFDFALGSQKIKFNALILSLKNLFLEIIFQNGPMIGGIFI